MATEDPPTPQPASTPVPTPRRSLGLWAVRGTGGPGAPDAAQAVDWAEDERRRFLPRREIARLLRRGRARILVAGLAALLCAGFVVRRALRQLPVYQASITLRVTEGVAAADTPEFIPPGQLRDYVVDVWLSRGVVLPVIEELGLFPDLVARDPALAVAALREDVGVDVYRNYFQEYRTSDDPPRSAHVFIAYTSPDPERALTIVQALGKAFVAFEQRTRQDVSAAAAEASRAAVDLARVDLLRSERALTAALVADANGEPGAASRHVDIARLRDEITREEMRLSALEGRQRQLALYSAAEAQQLGLDFDVVDVEVPTRVHRSTKRLIAVAVVVFLICLPLFAIVAGAFDPRIQDGDDVRRLGVELLGHVPGFAGDRVGALAGRVGAGARRGAKWFRVRK